MTDPAADDRARPPLAAIAESLGRRGFPDGHEHPPAPAAPELRTLLATCDRARCILSLDRDWLARHDPQSAVAWLDSQSIAELMLWERDADEVIVHDSGPGAPGLIHLPRVRLD